MRTVAAAPPIGSRHQSSGRIRVRRALQERRREPVKGATAMRSPVEVRLLLQTSERLWNDGDREGFLELWRTAVPGDYTLESPVGTEPRRGWDACRRDVWDDFHEGSRIHTRELIVCGKDVAA